MEKTSVNGYIEDLPNALICEDRQDMRNLIMYSLEELKYNVFIANNVEEAMENFKYNNIKLVVLNENYAGGTYENNEILEYLKFMSIHERRNIFLVLTGKSFESLDNMQAFANSVNVIINDKDFGNLTKILKRSIADNDNFYKVFKDVMKKEGKA